MNHLVINRQDAALTKDYLNTLRKIDLKYMLVKNFFSPDELKSIINDLHNLPEELYTTATAGYRIFPRTVANPGQNMADYFSISAEGTELLKKHVKVEVAKRFNDVFKQVNNDVPVEVLYGPDGNTKFIPINFRRMSPKVGVQATSHIHNGSTITMRNIDTLYKHLSGIIDFENQLSFFCLLQNSLRGGDLTIYDYTRKDYLTLSDGRYLNGNDGSKVDLEKTKNKVTVHMDPGDLIIFPGGQLWHRVEVIKRGFIKNGERISLGGFLAMRPTDNKWYYWI